MKILFLLIHRNNLIIIDNLLQHGVEVDIILYENSVQFEILNQLTSLYNNRYIAASVEKTEECLPKKNYDYIFPGSDATLSTVAILNEKFNLNGIFSDTVKLISTKISYYQLWQDLQVPVPALYDIVESCDTLSVVPKNIKYPCIVKPSFGSSSVGIQIIENQQSLIDFFADTTEQLHKYQEKNKTNYKKLQYLSQSHHYMIQTYIKGDVVSVIGHVYKEEIFFDFIFDIESTAYPYAAETGLKYPSKYSAKLLQDKTTIYLKKFFNKIKFNNGPFMLDVIIDNNNEIYFIDFSPRLSVSHTLMWHSGENNYGYKLINKLLRGIDYTLSIEKAVLFRQLPFKKKEIKHIEIKDKNIADVVSLPKGKIQMVRNDFSVYHNGWAIFTGSTLDDVEEKYRNFVSGLVVEYH